MDVGEWEGTEVMMKALGVDTFGALRYHRVPGESAEELPSAFRLARRRQEQDQEQLKPWKQPCRILHTVPYELMYNDASHLKTLALVTSNIFCLPPVHLFDSSKLQKYH